MPDTPFDVLADELGAVAARVERECLLRLSSLSSELQRQLAECEVRMMRMEQAVATRLADLRDGLPGEKGERGDVGERGLQGEKGEQGEKGDPGAAGERGEQGAQGVPGVDGEAGAAGVAGEPGAGGERGLTGERGEPGDKGGSGDKGERGERGEKGEQGEKAEPGEKGDRGDKGEAGEKGDCGQPGEPGAAGERGAPGEKGDEGPLGKLSRVKPWKPDSVFYDGDVVRHEGGTYQALKDTSHRPGSSEDWISLAASGLDGVNGRDFRIRDTYDAAAEYAALDVVTMNATWFVARQDNPGPCPGPGWKSGPVGKRGDKGERGLRGERGAQGEAARHVVRYQTDRKQYVAIPIHDDGSAGIAIPLRELFEQFESETRN